MDLEATDVSTQLHPEQIDEGFTTTAYPNVQDNLKITVEEHVILEEPASSTGTLSSLQYLDKDFSFGDLFFNDKPSEAENEKTTAETKAESMVSVTIQQDTFAIPLMTTPRIGELEQIMVNLIQDNKHLKERLDSHGARLYTLENLDIPQLVSKAVDEIVTDAVDWAIQAPLQNRFRDLPEADMKEILHQRMWETNSYKAHEDHMMLYEALDKSMNRDHTDELLKYLAEARRKKKKRCDSPKMPPGSPPHQPLPPPPPAGLSGTSGSPGASGLSQVPPPPPPPPSTNQEDLHMDADMAPDAQVHSSDDEVIENAHIPKSIPSSNLPVLTNNWASSLTSTYTPPPENSLLAQAGDMAMFMDWFYKRQGITELKPQDLEGPAFELVKVFHPNVIHLQYQMEECHKILTDSVDESIIRHNFSKPLPLGGPRGQVTIQYDFFFNKDLEYLRYGCKGGRPALSISKIKAAYYPDDDEFGKLELAMKMWNGVLKATANMEVKEVIKVLVRHTSEGDRRAVRTHMRILSVVRIEVFSMYGQRVEDFLLAIESYQTQLNLTKPRWDATCFQYKHEFTIIDSSRAVTFRDKYGVQMIMRFNEIHKFSDGTLHQIDEALDYRVKEFKVNRINPGLNTRFWTSKDVDRSKEFMFAIQKWLKTRRIFRNLESFVGGRNRRDLPRDNPLVRVEVLRKDLEKEKSKNKGRVPTEMDLELEQTQQVYSSLRSLKPKCTIESRAKRSSKKILLGHYSIMLASSHTVKSKTDIKSPTHYPRVGFNSLIHSLRALSTLRRSGLRTAAVRPCQGDSSELYLITGSPGAVSARTTLSNSRHTTSLSSPSISSPTSPRHHLPISAAPSSTTAAAVTTPRHNPHNITTPSSPRTTNITATHHHITTLVTPAATTSSSPHLRNHPHTKVFGKILEDIHVSWAHLEKNWTRLQLYTKVVEEKSSQWLETVSEIPVKPSRLQRDGVKNLEMDNLSTTMEEYVQFETKKALRQGQVYNWKTAQYDGVSNSLNMTYRLPDTYARMEKVAKDEHKGESETYGLLKIDVNLFTSDTPLRTIYDEFFQGMETFGANENMNDGNTIQANQECIGDYGLMMGSDDDFRDLVNYLVPNDAPFIVHKKERRCKLLYMSCKWVSNIEHEFDIWEKTKENDYPLMVEAFLCRIFVLVSKTFALQVTGTGRSARSYVMHGASFTQRIVSSIPIGGSISPKGFLLLILLLVVIIVTVVIVVVILIVVVAIVRVVITIIGVVVVVVGGVFIIKLSFVIIGVLCRIVFYYLIHQPLGYADSFLESLRF
nr:hypothetical protein [Tanacetum cinerariifolium]